MNIRYLICALFLAFLLAAGCVLPPTREGRTPAVSGHVIDAVSHSPLAHATVSFLRLPEGNPEKLNGPNTTTDANGQFKLPATYNYHAFSVFIPEGWDFEAGPTGGSYLLQVEEADHRSRIVNLQSAYKASGLGGTNREQSIFKYDGTFPIGDILLDAKNN